MGGELAGESPATGRCTPFDASWPPLFRPRTRAVTRRLDAEALAVVGKWASPSPEESRSGRLLQHAVERANQVLLGYARQRPSRPAAWARR